MIDCVRSSTEPRRKARSRPCYSIDDCPRLVARDLPENFLDWLEVVVVTSNNGFGAD